MKHAETLTERRMRPRHALILLIVAALWGASFLFIRIAAPVLGPVVLIDVRMALAGLALVLFGVGMRRRPSLHGRSREWLIVGALWALPFTLIAFAEVRLTASLAAILNATTPLFSALVGALWLGDRLDSRRTIGLGLGFLGVLIVVGWSPLELSPPVLVAAGASLLAAGVYALAGVYGARNFRGVPSLDLATGQQLAGALVLLPLLPLSAGRGEPAGGAVVLAVLALALVCTAAAFVLFFRLVAELGPTTALTITFLVPAFGMLWGSLFLGERVSWSLAGGLAVVLVGVALVTGAWPRLRRS